ncbi:hypothetical protein AB685_23595 [Bacillus sp. LL01]|uniref:hypothetical protein n=1 Tax=Bacillus sp. LL01 TaxID=1665556 RepID=UPI00064D189C|nr:hypothetical protein [Bacillus sp. LL01]KMJ56138.1 hypothetical protein AB685_23595 [Bacillus sp. LL01]
MSIETTFTKEQHRQMAVSLFNRTWDLMDKADRTEDEELEMIHIAHTSRYHWGVVGDHVNWSRGEWQISRMYALIGAGEAALKHALANKRIHDHYQLTGFDAAFVAEALARAYHLLGETEHMKAHLAYAHQQAAHIEKESDRDYVLAELATISG